MFNKLPYSNLHDLNANWLIKKVQAVEGVVEHLPEKVLEAITSLLPWTVAQGGTGADNAEDARTNLDVYSKAEVDDLIPETPISIANGGTGAATAADARTNLDVYPTATVDAINTVVVSLSQNMPTASNPLPISRGGTGSVNALDARTSLDVYSKAEVQALIQPGGLLDTIYPVGCIYQSTVLESSVTSGCPIEATLGGTWVRIQDKFLLGASSSHAAGTTGGEETHTLTSNEMPSHDHMGKIYFNQDGHGVTVPDYAVYISRYAPNTDPEILRNADTPLPDKNYRRIGYTDPAGGDAAHNNMPPYQAVYIWQRTA